MKRKWIVETPVDLWLATGATATEAIAQVQKLTTHTPLYAAPLPRLDHGRPRRVTFGDDRWAEGGLAEEFGGQRPDADEVPPHSE